MRLSPSNNIRDGGLRKMLNININIKLFNEISIAKSLPIYLDCTRVALCAGV